MIKLKSNAWFMLLATALISGTAVAEESNWSLGHGYASGGALGVQYQWLQEQYKLTAAVGLVGAAVGVQRSLGDAGMHSIGLATGVEAITAESGFLIATYQYYPSGFANSGFRLGFSAGARREDEGRFYGGQGKKETKAVVMFELGYQF